MKKTNVHHYEVPDGWDFGGILIKRVEGYDLVTLIDADSSRYLVGAPMNPGMRFTVSVQDLVDFVDIITERFEDNAPEENT